LPGQDVQLWEYSVLVTNSRYGLDAMQGGFRAVKSRSPRRKWSSDAVY
jgi:hypothetical protein